MKELKQVLGSPLDSELTMTPEQEKETKSIALVVEDDLNLKTVLTRIIQSIDPRIQVKWMEGLDDAFSYLHTIEVSGKERPRLILSDIILPSFGNGVDLWKFCRQRFPHVPFVFMSSLRSDQYLGRFNGEEVKCPPFLTKPIRVPLGISILETAVKKTKP